jgi:hypothetical protein
MVRGGRLHAAAAVFGGMGGPEDPRKPAFLDGIGPQPVDSPAVALPDCGISPIALSRCLPASSFIF